MEEFTESLGDLTFITNRTPEGRSPLGDYQLYVVRLGQFVAGYAFKSDLHYRMARCLIRVLNSVEFDNWYHTGDPEKSDWIHGV